MRRTLIVTIEVDENISDQMVNIVMLDVARMGERRLADPFTRRAPTATVEVVRVPDHVEVSHA